MAFRLLKNAIITGHIDAYCLVCERHLRSIGDIHNHIIKPIHIKNLDATGYFEEFKDDCVRKVKRKYFCEYCNILFPTAAKVRLHVVEPMHVANKGTQRLKRIGSFIIAFDNVLIDEKAWNGVKGDACVICGVEFDNEGIHKTETMHIINLIQSNIEFGPNNTVYRKIDESSFQCLTCNDVFVLKNMSAHFDDTNHKKLYSECRQAYIASKVANEKQAVEVNMADDKPKTSATIAKEQKPDGQKESIKVIVTSAKQPDPPLHVEMEKIPEVSVISAINPNNPTKEAKKEVKKLEEAKPKLQIDPLSVDEQICSTLKAKNYIAIDVEGRPWCILCDWILNDFPADIHLESKHHQALLKMHKMRMERKQAIKLSSDKSAILKKDKLQETRNPILDMLPELEKNDIKVDYKGNVAFCKRCNIALDFEHLAIQNHIMEQHKTSKKEVKKTTNNNKKIEDAIKSQNIVEDAKKPQSPTTKKTRSKKKRDRGSRASSAASTRESDEDVEKIEKTNSVVLNHDNNTFYCRVCDTRTLSTPMNMYEHISSTTHKRNVAMKSLNPNLMKTIVKITVNDFIADIVVFDSQFRDVVINQKYVLNYFSFIMMTKYYHLRCEVCQVEMDNESIQHHKIKSCHHKAMYETKVVASWESEFIRETRPDHYHCGYCNVIRIGIDDLANHLHSTTHNEAKTSAMWLLEQYCSDINSYRKLNPPTSMNLADILNIEMASND